MRLKLSAAAIAFVLAAVPVTEALAASCLDLWYERNAIYDENGYCFATDLAQEYFDNDDCWTKHPVFQPCGAAPDRRCTRAEEKRRHCKVN